NLREFAVGQMKGPPICLIAPQAVEMFRQFCETAAYRTWELRAVAIMRTHVHLVVGVLGDPDPHKVLGDFKSYASRALSKQWGKPKMGDLVDRKGIVSKAPRRDSGSRGNRIWEKSGECAVDLDCGGRASAGIITRADEGWEMLAAPGGLTPRRSPAPKFSARR